MHLSTWGSADWMLSQHSDDTYSTSVWLICCTSHLSTAIPHCSLWDPLYNSWAPRTLHAETDTYFGMTPQSHWWLVDLLPSLPHHPCPCVHMWRIIHQCPIKSPASTSACAVASPDSVTPSDWSHMTHEMTDTLPSDQIQPEWYLGLGFCEGNTMTRPLLISEILWKGELIGYEHTTD